MENIERENIEALLAGYVLGDLSPEEAERVQQHLASHPELQAEVSSLQTTLSLLPLSLSEKSPPKNLRSQILEAAETPSSSSNVLPFNPQPRQNKFSRKQKSWLGLATSIAAVFIAGLGWQNYNLTQQLATAERNTSQSQQEIAALKSQMQANKSNLLGYRQVLDILNQPNNRFLAVKGMSSQMPASGSLVIAPNKQTALLALQNLPDLPKGKVYRMWAYVDGQKVDCTRFTPDSAGKVMQQIPLNNWGNTTSVIVTIEPEQGITQPTGEKVMLGNTSI